MTVLKYVFSPECYVYCSVLEEVYRKSAVVGTVQTWRYLCLLPLICFARGHFKGKRKLLLTALLCDLCDWEGDCPPLIPAEAESAGEY